MRRVVKQFLRPRAIARSATLGLLFSVSVSAAVTSLTDDGTISATVTWSDVIMPAGRIILVKSSEGICALQFVAFERANDARPGSSIDNGEETQITRYEWRFFTNGGLARSGRGSVTHKAAYGIGRWILFGGGNDIVKCGPMRAFWAPPGSLFFSDDPGCASPKFELSPTSWTNLRDVDPSDPHIRWFKCDMDREPLQIVLGHT